MKFNKSLLLVVLAFAVIHTGCSNQNSSQSQKNVDQPVVNKEQTKQAGTHFILGGMTKEQGESFGKAVEQAQAENEPISKGRELEKQGKWNEAIQHYQTLLGSKKFEWDAHRGLARVYEQMGDFKNAVIHFEQAPLAEWAKTEWEQKLSELKAKAAQQTQE